MEETFRAILCPCCKKFLYALEGVSRESGVAWVLAKGSPAVNKDAEGHFLTCPQCSKRIAIEKPSSGSGPEWQVSATQKCG